MPRHFVRPSQYHYIVVSTVVKWLGVKAVPKGRNGMRFLQHCSRKSPATVEWEDEKVIAIRDANPKLRYIY